MTRIVVPELLDELPPDDPEAIASRQDLVKVNAWMGNTCAAARVLRQLLPADQSVTLADIGAGDGRFMLRVLQLLGFKSETRREIVLVDRQSVPHQSLAMEFERLGWKLRLEQCDVLEWVCHTPGKKFNAVCANLFLHHFEDDQLRELFAGLATITESFVALEPSRSARALALSKLLIFIGCNRITRHDAAISIRAGFTGTELSRLWPGEGLWRTLERPNGMAGHLFEARLR